MYPRQSPTTHTEHLGDEASVYDWARAQVHALNPTAARVWRQCDGTTSPDAMAAALARELIPEARAVVDLTLRKLARLHLLEEPLASRGDRPAITRRWLLRHGVAAAMLPVIASIVAPTPVEAQSASGAGAPTLTSLSPNQGFPGDLLTVTLTGTHFVVSGTNVTVGGSGVLVTNVVVASATSLTAIFLIDRSVASGPRTVTATTASGTSGAQTFTVTFGVFTPTLDSVSPNQGAQGATVVVRLSGNGFVGKTTVTVGGGGVMVTSVVVASPTFLTAKFVLDPTATPGGRTVTVMNGDGLATGAQTFTVTTGPPPRSEEFFFTGSPEPFTVPAGVVSITIQATGAQGGVGHGTLTCNFGPPPGLGGPGGRTTATLAVTPGTALTVVIGGIGRNGQAGGSGGFNGGGSGSGTAFGGGGGGASSVFTGATPLVIAGGGGGAGLGCQFASGSGGSGGGLIADPGTSLAQGGGGGGGGTQVAGGIGGATPGGTGIPGTAGVAGMGGTGGKSASGQIGGGGGGGGYYGGGGGGGGIPPNVGGSGGGGGSSFTAPGATAVVHEMGVFGLGDGLVTITW